MRTKLETAEIEDEDEGKRWARGARTVLRAQRNDADLTQEQLAVRLGWSKKSVVDLESGRKAMQVEHVANVARAVGIEPVTAFARIAHWVQTQPQTAGPTRFGLRKQTGSKPAALAVGQRSKDTVRSRASGRPKPTAR